MRIGAIVGAIVLGVGACVLSVACGVAVVGIAGVGSIPVIVGGGALAGGAAAGGAIGGLLGGIAASTGSGGGSSSGDSSTDPSEVHGSLRGEERHIDENYVWQHGDLYTDELSGRLIRVLDNGNGTSDVVIRDPGSDRTITQMRVKNSYVENRVARGE